MNRYIVKKLILSIILLLGLVTSPGIASAAASGSNLNVNTFALTSKDEACESLKALDSNQKCGSGENTINGLVKKIVNILSFIIGVVAIIMILVSGLKYITSNGDASGISNAKSTLIYALIGLAVAALAQFLVQFVLKNVKV